MLSCCSLGRLYHDTIDFSRSFVVKDILANLSTPAKVKNIINYIVFISNNIYRNNSKDQKNCLK